MATASTPEREPARARFFIALWPPDDVRLQLEAVADALMVEVARARRVPRANFHVTLAFIGSLDIDRACEVARELANWSTGTFDWKIDRVGFFPRARIAWAGGADAAHVHGAADRVRSGLRSMRIDFDAKPFVPHVTLLRDVVAPGRGRPLATEIAWRCGPPLLVRSESTPTGVRYVPMDAP